MAAITGSCLCGGVRFELREAVGPFELCHCARCRKSTGSAFAASLTVHASDYTLLAGRDLIAIYDAPVLERPPAYRRAFCTRCGAAVPDPEPGETLEIPAGLLDADPQVRPDKHIFVEHEPPWFDIAPDAPRMTKAMLRAWRRGER